jgi:hypothetical protein
MTDIFRAVFLVLIDMTHVDHHDFLDCHGAAKPHEALGTVISVHSRKESRQPGKLRKIVLAFGNRRSQLENTN